MTQAFGLAREDQLADAAVEMLREFRGSGSFFRELRAKRAAYDDSGWFTKGGGTTFGTIKGAVEAGAGMVVDTAKTLIEQRISQDHEALQQNLEKLDQWTAVAALLGQQKIQGTLIDTAKQAWEIAPPPEKACMVAGLVTNVLAGMATGGAGLGARVATLMNVGALGSLAPTTEGGQ